MVEIILRSPLYSHRFLFIKKIKKPTSTISIQFSWNNSDSQCSVLICAWFPFTWRVSFSSSFRFLLLLPCYFFGLFLKYNFLFFLLYLSSFSSKCFSITSKESICIFFTLSLLIMIGFSLKKIPLDLGEVLGLKGVCRVCVDLTSGPFP